MGSPMETTQDFHDDEHQMVQASSIACNTGENFDDDMIGMLEQVASL
jgi:hypothetical protein